MSNIKIDLTDICLNDLDKLNIESLEKDNIINKSVYDNLVDNLLITQPSYSFSQKEYEEDYNVVIKNYPIYSILSIDNLNSSILDNYIKRLPDVPFSAHISTKIDGEQVRLVYKEGNLIKAFNRNDNEVEVKTILNDLITLDDINGLDYAEIRGIIADNNFIAYDFVGDDVEFESKQELYDYLEELGFEVPLYWVVDDLTNVTLKTELKGIVSDCEIEITADEENNISGYPYKTSGLVFTLNDYEMSKEIGTFGNKFDLSSIVLNVFTKEVFSGVIQTILWKQDIEELKPYALIANDIDVIDVEPYIFDINKISNIEDLGVSVNNTVITEVPLYDASNMIKLDAYVGNSIYFISFNDKIVPCYADGTIVNNRKELVV